MRRGEGEASASPAALTTSSPSVGGGLSDAAEWGVYAAVVEHLTRGAPALREGGSVDPQAAELVRLVRTAPALVQVLEVVRALQLPDPLVFSGAVYQTVWNALTGRPADYGVKDYDVGYFDTDTSYDAEDVVIRRMAGVLDEPLRSRVEVRNQARVHLWFPAHFGSAYDPLSSSAEALTRFVCPAFAVGVRLEADDEITVAAPFGLDDVFAMRLRPNPLRHVARDWDRVVGSVQQRWPELVVAP